MLPPNCQYGTFDCVGVGDVNQFVIVDSGLLPNAGRPNTTIENASTIPFLNVGIATFVTMLRNAVSGSSVKNIRVSLRNIEDFFGMPSDPCGTTVRALVSGFCCSFAILPPSILKVLIG